VKHAGKLLGEKSLVPSDRLAATVALMPGAYEQLLDAAIQHLQDLKARGVRFVAVSPQTLAALNQPHRLAPPKAPSPPRLPPPQRVERPVAKPGSHPRPSRRTSAWRRTVGAAVFAGEARVVAPAPTLSPEAKVAAFADLRQRALACVKCPHLASSRKNVALAWAASTRN